MLSWGCSALHQESFISAEETCAVVCGWPAPLCRLPSLCLRCLTEMGDLQRLLAADIELKHLTSVVYMPVISASPRLRQENSQELEWPAWVTVRICLQKPKLEKQKTMFVEHKPCWVFLLIWKLQSGPDLSCDFPLAVSCVVECLKCVLGEM